jgi:molybdenum cofactor cytidylyltransferase
MVRGVILAAGASSRMGRPKAALPLADRADTFVSRLVRTFLGAGVPEVLVVTGAHDADVRRTIPRFDRRVRVIHNPQWMDGQLTSLHAALRARARTGRVQDLEAVLMTLVDIPLASPATVAAVLCEWRRTRAPIVRPARGDLHGRPVLFDRVLFDELLRADPQVGAKAVVRAHAHEILNLPLNDEGAFFDVDTDADYAALRSGLQSSVFGGR